MAMPRSIKLGPYRLKVRRPREIKWPGQRKQDQRKVWATYSYARRLIDVLRGVKPPMAQDLLLHEIGHAVWEYTGLQAVPALAKYEEQVISAWSTTWLMVIQDNPALIRYLEEKH